MTTKGKTNKIDPLFNQLKAIFEFHEEGATRKLHDILHMQ
jgi:hypothetical protein